MTGNFSPWTGLTLKCPKGEIFGFLGPNGAGKSTTQKILTGLLQLQEGEVEVGGINMQKPTTGFFNMIGVCFESPTCIKN